MRSQTSQFLAKFRILHPVIQSPMAGSSTVEMAAAITNNGGIGSLPLGSDVQNSEAIRTKISKFKSLVDNEVKKNLGNVNFFAHEPVVRDSVIEKNWIAEYKKIYLEHGLEWKSEGEASLSLLYDTFKSIDDTNHNTVSTLVELNPQIVSFHFGIPNIQVLQHLQSHGISIFITATSLNEFKELIDAKVDGVVLQGWEAGGHRGNFEANDPNDKKLSTKDLVEEVIKYIDEHSLQNPPWLIAAGGIVDSITIQSLLDLGIAGVQLGTVFLPTSASTAPKELKEIIQDPMNRKTIMTPALSGRNLRTVSSPFLKSLSKLDSFPTYPLPYDSFKNLNKDASPSTEFLGLLAGSDFYRAWKGTDQVEEVLRLLTKDLKYI